MKQRVSHTDAVGRGALYRRVAAARLGLLLASTLAATLAVAQPGVPTRDDIATRLAAVEADANLDDAARKRLVDILHRADSALQQAEQRSAAAQTLREQFEATPARMADFTARVAQAPPPPKSVPADLDAAGLEAYATQVKAVLSAARARYDDVAQTLEALRQRPQAAAAERAETNATLEALRAAPASQGARSSTPEAIATAAGLAALQAQVKLLDQESIGLDSRIELAELELQLVERDVQSSQVHLAATERWLANKQRKEARAAAMDAERSRREVASKHPLLNTAAEKNTELSRFIGESTDELQRLRKARQAANERARELARRSAQSRERVRLAGQSDTLGRVLRKERDRLPSTAQLERETASRRAQLNRLGSGQVELDELREPLLNLDAAVEAQLEQDLPATTSAEQRSAVRADLQALFADRLRLVNSQLAIIDDMIIALGDYEVAHTQLAADAASYRQFLDERLLWLPSANPIGWDTLRDLPAAMAWLAHPAHWRDALGTLRTQALAHWAFSLFAVLVPIALLWLRPRLKRMHAAINAKLKRIQSDSFAHTARALVLTLMGAAAWPLLLGLPGYLLERTTSASEFTRALGSGAVETAWLMMFIFTVVSICRRDGIGSAHFRWPEASLAQVRRNFMFTAMLLAPTAFVTSVLAAHNDALHLDSLGRVGFIIACLALAALQYELLHPRKGVPAQMIARNPQAWSSRLAPLWFFILVSLPLALAALAAAGFMYTALRLTERGVATAMVLSVALVVNYLVLRWLYVTRRRLEFERRIADRLARRAQAEAEDTGTETLSHDPPAVEEPELDLEAIDTQTRHLLKVFMTVFVLGGLFIVWSDILPALDFLERIQLWQYISTDANGTEVATPVTLKSLIMLIALGILVWAAARNLPGVLEIAILQRLPLDSGSRYAITTIAQYIIVAFGVSTLLNTLGVGWTNIQWLVAALSVGLGFGLQEIFGNFISGLILLFERPVRIGDTVTVGTVSGTVTRIRIRATTIADWDGKETIVPNKTFITGDLTNWTLTNTVTRVVLPVGVAYGSDTGLVERLLFEVANRNPLVLEDPEPQVFFVGLGASSLDFELRVFTRQLGERLPTAHELLADVVRVFAEHDIGIPFPQRDLHVHYVGGPTSPIPAAQPAAPAAPRRRIDPDQGAA